MTVLDYLKTKCAGEFAFWINPVARVVYFTTPTVVGPVAWPSEVCLFQALCGRHFDLYEKEIFLLRSGRSTLDTMGQGMASHLKVVIRDGEKLTTPLPDAMDYRFERVDSQPILGRHEKLAQAFQNSPLNGVDLGNHGSHVHRLYMAAAFRLIRIFTPWSVRPVGSLNHQVIARSGGHNIAAVLVARTGEVLAMALNTASSNKTLHAEVNALQAMAKAGANFPSQTYLYTTMKPCDMCAAMIAQLLPDCTVLFAQEDPRAEAVLRPTGGMRLLASVVGAKQIKLLDRELNKTGRALIPELATMTQRKQHNTAKKDRLYYLTNVVDDHEMAQLMEQGQRNLEHKMAKYKQENLENFGVKGASQPAWNIKHPEILPVLRHLAPILRLEYQIKSPQEYWEQLLQDFEPKSSEDETCALCEVPYPVEFMNYETGIGFVCDNHFKDGPGGGAAPVPMEEEDESLDQVIPCALCEVPFPVEFMDYETGVGYVCDNHFKDF